MKIDSLIVKDSSKNVIIDVKGGISKNILMIDKKKNPIDGYSYKRKTMKYGYNQGKYQIYMDNEILNGATIEIKYLITITNNSEVDTLGSDGSLGTAYYQGIYSPNDVIVTTQIDKIIDYIDNSSTFVKENSIEWSLVENMDEFLTDDIKAQVQITGEVQTETDKRNKETYLNNLRSALGTNFVNENIALYEKQYREEQINKSTAWSTIDNDNNKGIRNQEILKHMQNMGYLDKTLEFVQTKSGRTVNQGITQTAVTEILDTEQDKMIPSSTKLYSEYEVSVRSKKAVVLTLSKTLSPNDETDSYDYRNVAEILQYTNDAGRRDMDAVPGNQDPNVTESMSWFLGGKKEVMPYEYDSDLAERIFITPPTGENRNYVLYTIVAGISLIVIAGVVIIVRKKIMHK